MFTLEQKVDLILRYIATNDNAKKSQLKKMVVKALESSESVPTTVLTVDDLIVDMLKALGMPQHLKGYGYIVKGIKLCIQNPKYLSPITYRLYPALADLFETTTGGIERNIRRVIEAMFDNGDIDNITRIFGNTMSVSKGKLSNYEFIVFCTNEITRKMKKLGIEVK